MKTTARFLYLMLMLAWTMPLSAQHHAHDAKAPGKVAPMDSAKMGGMMSMMQGDKMPPMHGDMMEKMMGDPISFSNMLIPALPTMKDPLALSDEQVATLTQSAAAYQGRQREISDLIAKAETKIHDLVDSDEPDSAQLKKLLRDAAMHSADLKAMGFETAMEMKGQLSAEQRAKLSAVTPMQMHQHMMSNMTMAEMKQAMHCDMMMDHDGDAMPRGMQMMKPEGMKRPDTMMKSDAMPKKMEMMNHEGMEKPDENRK